MNIPKDAQGKTAGQRDREARKVIARERALLNWFLLILIVAAGAAVAFAVWIAVTS